MSNTLIFFLSNSTSGSLKTCVNMLEQYCTSGVERKPARALTDYINYICSTEGQKGDVHFITVYLLYHSIMLLWYRDELADEIVNNIISWCVIFQTVKHIGHNVFCFIKNMGR